MALLAAWKSYGTSFNLNLNERPAVESLEKQEVSCRSLHVVIPRQLSVQRFLRAPVKSRRRWVQGARASSGRGSVRRSEPGDSVPGDPKLQDELVDILRIEIAKAQMSMFCDEEADKLREIAAEGLKELDRKYKNTILNSINQVNAQSERALRELDADAARFRREIEESKAKAEASARDSELLEQSIFEARNERLFFKNLYAPAKSKPLTMTPAQTRQLQQELKAIQDVSTGSFASTYRRVLYGALSIVMTSALWSTATAFTSGNPVRWSKVVIYVAILGAILMQFWFENQIVGEHSGGAASGPPESTD